MKLLSRRSLLGSAMAGALAYASARAASPSSSDAQATEARIVQSFYVVNTADTAQRAGFIPQMIGLVFRKGDIPTGAYPMLKFARGEVVMFSMPSGLSRTWSDGSLKRATFLIRIPVSLPGNREEPQGLKIDVYNNGVAPGSSARSLADFSAGDTSLQIVVTGADGTLAGTWTSYLNHGISNTNQSGGKTDITDYGDGPVGHLWKIKASFEQAGSPHGQLEGYWYVAALQDSSGGLYGLRVLGAVMQPWYNDTQGTKSYRAFSTFKLQNGATVLRDLIDEMPPPKQIAWTSGVSFRSEDHGFYPNIAVQISSSDGPSGLPANVLPSTTYFVGWTDANNFALGVNSAAASGHPISAPSSAGTGTITATPVAYVVWGGMLYTAGGGCTFDYVQGAGSWAPVGPLTDGNSRVVMNTSYWRRSGCAPAWDTSTKTKPSTTNRYFPNAIVCGVDSYTPGHGLTPFEPETGEGPERALLPGWCTKHYLNQDAATEQTVRAMGLCASNFPLHIRDFATGQIPVVNEKSYPGMPNGNVKFQWTVGASNSSGFSVPSNPNVWFQVINFSGTDHMPDLSTYQFLFTGEPQYEDQMAMWANYAVYNRGPGVGVAVSNDTANWIGSHRAPIISGTTYQGITVGETSVLRIDAWATRNASNAAAFVSDANKSKPYLQDIFSRTMQACNAFNANQTAWAKATGYFYFNEYSSALGFGYFIAVIAYAVSANESADALALLNWCVKYPAYICNTFGAWHVGHYNAITRQNRTVSAGSYASYPGPLIVADAQWGVEVGSATVQQSSSSFLIRSRTTNYQIANGQSVIFSDGFGAAPAPLTWYSVYYMVNADVDSGTFQLSATRGGSAILLTGGAGSHVGFNGIFLDPPENTTCSANSAEGYNTNVLGALKAAQAVGASVDTSTISALQNIFDAGQVNFEDTCIYCYSAEKL